MDTIFGHEHVGWFNVVKAAKDEPRRYDKHGKLLEDPEVAARTMQEKDARQGMTTGDREFLHEVRGMEKEKMSAEKFEGDADSDRKSR